MPSPDRQPALYIHAGPARRRLPLIAAMLVASAAAFAFGFRTLDAGFIMGDDQRFITEHFLVAHPSVENAWKLLTIPHGDLYQPLPMLSFQANFAMASIDADGVSPFAFHLTNVILHMINAAFVVVLAFSMTRRVIVAALVGILFAVHPMAMETVAWVNGRMILLATLFSLIVFILAVRRPRMPEMSWPIGMWVAWVAALLSKVLPTVPIAAWLFDRATHRRDSMRGVWTYAVLFAIGLAAAVAMSQLSASEGFATSESNSAGDAIQTVLLAANRYIDQYVVPTQLSPWTPPQTNISGRDPHIVFAGFKLALFVFVAFALRKRAPVVSASLAAFLLLLAPFLFASLARRLFVADRYMYLPMVGLHLALVISVAALVDRYLARGTPTRTSGRIIAVPFAALGAWWLWIGVGLAPVWQNTMTYAGRVLTVFPDQPDAHNELARAQLFMNRPTDALDTIAAALKHWPDEPRLAAQAGEAYRALGQHESAVESFDAMLAKHPEHTRTRYLRALSLIEIGQKVDATRALESLVSDQPSFLPAYRSLASLYRDDGDVKKQRITLENAVELNPYHRDNIFDLAMLDFNEGRLKEAEQGFKRLTQLSSTDEPALLNLGAVLARQGRHVEAIKCYDRLLQIRPKEQSARFNRGDLLIAMGQHAAADADFRALLESDLSNIDAAARIHEILYARKDWDALRQFWPQFIAASGRSAEADCFALWADMLISFDRREPLPLPIRNAAQANPSAGIDCADWARVYARLREQDWDALTTVLSGQKISAEKESIAVIERRRRIWMPAFGDLPVELRNSRPGLFVLARLLQYFGDTDQAAAIASNLTGGNDAWAQLAKDMIESHGN